MTDQETPESSILDAYGGLSLKGVELALSPGSALPGLSSTPSCRAELPVID